MDYKNAKPRLPKLLIDEIGDQALDNRSSNFRVHSSSRKEARKAARSQKRGAKHGIPPPKRIKLNNKTSRERDHSFSIESSPTGECNALIQSRSGSFESIEPEHKEKDFITRLATSGASCNKNKKIEEEDRKIAALEKKLGLKNSKKLPKSFEDDGLNELLVDLEDEEDSEIGGKDVAKSEGDEWLRHKRQGNQRSKPDIDTESFKGFDSEDCKDKPDFSKVRENPYLPPKDLSIGAKYRPPSLRKLESSSSEDLGRLRRRIQGLINRLTESNLISILGEIENLYRQNPRQHVTSTLLDVILVAVCEPTTLSDALVILPAGLISAIYKVIGTDFGAEAVQRISVLWDEYYLRSNTMSLSHSNTSFSKETSNIIMLLAQLYIFQVVGSNLLFDYIRLILEKFSELNSELLLKIIRVCGAQLRQDDPSSLKHIVAMVQAARVNVDEQKISVRTKFMIESITELKNNRLKVRGAATSATSDHIVQMKKILGSLNNRNIKGTEPLRISLKDIQDSNKKGKWWLVGASWSGHKDEVSNEITPNDVGGTTVPTHDTETSDLIQLAREQRMNTDVRRAIFVTILSATDYQDAYIRLKKLRLKKLQEYEIPKVLIHCATSEKHYNPYYALIARKLCEDKKLKMSFQYCLWDIFKRLEESEEEDSGLEKAEEYSSRNLVNLGKMFGTLIIEDCLSLNILKKLNLGYLSPKTKTFVEILFITIFLQSQKESELRRDEKPLVFVFSKVDDPPLIASLQYFLKKIVSKTDIAGGKTERETVKWACKVARDILRSSFNKK
ncbi:hypothetical protein Golomagni_04985 [Golovinomyces magnicellulatus]|nr:hypothetical protein Golomagni_04985 [Golovinomyces magnicellulatus]